MNLTSWKWHCFGWSGGRGPAEGCVSWKGAYFGRIQKMSNDWVVVQRHDNLWLSMKFMMWYNHLTRWQLHAYSGLYLLPIFGRNRDCDDSFTSESGCRWTNWMRIYCLACFQIISTYLICFFRFCFLFWFSADVHQRQFNTDTSYANRIVRWNSKVISLRISEQFATSNNQL